MWRPGPRAVAVVRAPAADPWPKIRDATTVAAAASGAACVGACGPLVCSGLCPPAVLLAPLTACGGGVGAAVITHVALHEPAEQRPLLVGSLTAAGVLLGGVVGGGVGLLLSTFDGSDPVTGGIVGAAIGVPTLGVLGAGLGAVAVELIDTEELFK